MLTYLLAFGDLLIVHRVVDKNPYPLSECVRYASAIVILL